MKFLHTLTILLATSMAAAKEQPNIIVLLADDLGYAELGCQGNTDIPTPHIDSIAENGVRETERSKVRSVGRRTSGSVSS